MDLFDGERSHGTNFNQTGRGLHDAHCCRLSGSLASVISDQSQKPRESEQHGEVNLEAMRWVYTTSLGDDLVNSVGSILPWRFLVLQLSARRRLFTGDQLSIRLPDLRSTLTPCMQSQIKDRLPVIFTVPYLYPAGSSARTRNRSGKERAAEDVDSCRFKNLEPWPVLASPSGRPNIPRRAVPAVRCNLLKTPRLTSDAGICVSSSDVSIRYLLTRFRSPLLKVQVEHFIVGPPQRKTLRRHFSLFSTMDPQTKLISLRYYLHVFFDGDGGVDTLICDPE